MNKKYYIFVNSETLEFIKRQQRFNRKTALLGVFGIICTAALTYVVSEQQKKIMLLTESRES